MKTIFTLGALLMALSSQSFACDKLTEGQYFCVYKEGAITQMTVDYGKDARGKYLIYNGNEEKLYLDGNPFTVNDEDGLYNVVASCSDDGRTFSMTANIYGTDQIAGTMTLAASHSPGMNFKSEADGFSEEAYCYRKFFRD